MGKNLEINNKIQNYIQDLSKTLHPVQNEIISYNETLGDIKKNADCCFAMSFLRINYKNF